MALYKKLATSITNKLQKAIFIMPFFKLIPSKKNRFQTCYSSFFSKQTSPKAPPLIIRILKFSSCIILPMMVPCAYAETTNNFFPRGCEVRGFGYSNHFLIINENGDQTFYLMQNKSSSVIELEHHETNPDVFMSPKLECKMSPYRWSAFASDVKNMHFNCFKIENGQKVTTNCADVLEICQYPRAKFAVSNMGSYWVSTNKVQTQVVQDSIHKGIFLRW